MCLTERGEMNLNPFYIYQVWLTVYRYAEVCSVRALHSYYDYFDYLRGTSLADSYDDYLFWYGKLELAWFISRVIILICQIKLCL